MIWLTTLITNHALALTLEQMTVKKISAAHSVAEVQLTHDRAENIRVARLACKLQLRDKMIPESCYRALKLEAAFGLTVSKHLQARLDRKCEMAARTLSHIPKLEIKALSRSCRDFVDRARELLAYKLDSD